MGFFTSSNFASASAAGTDWRDTSKKVLEMIERARTDNDAFNIGFLYISDELAVNGQSILNLFKSVTGIEHWTGAVGVGVCGTGARYLDGAAIAVMIGRIPESDFCVFPPLDPAPEEAQVALDGWMQHKDPMLVLVHGDPESGVDPEISLARLEQMTGGFIAGGLSSSRGEHIQFADEIVRGGFSGAAFAQEIEVASALSQGCKPFGTVHTITRCEDNVVMELDGRRAFDVFAEDLRELVAAQKAERGEDVPGEDMPGEDGAEQDGQAPDRFTGEVHVAFPVKGADDQQDYLVRHALGIDPDNGYIAVARQVENGEQMVLVHRDDKTVRADLSSVLLSLRQRVQDDTGVFAPKGALYISCVARTMSDFSGEKDEEDAENNGASEMAGEMGLVREILGDIPLAGFYANGEVSNHRIYSYTAVIILFL